MTPFRALVSYGLALLLAAGCASSPQKGSVTPFAPGETQVGHQIHSEIMSAFYPYTEPQLRSYIEGIGSSLAMHAARAMDYQFTVLYSDKIYATSSPGGYVYLTTGLLYFLDNEAQLAAVIGHEIGQLQFQDPRLSSTRRAFNAFAQGSAMVMPMFGQIGVLALLGVTAVHALADSRIKTEDEKLVEADAFALDYMVKAGYDPQGMEEFFYKVAQAPQPVIPYFYDYYQSRPVSTQRFEAYQAHFGELPLEGKSLNVNREEYLRATKGVREIYRG